MKRGRKVSEVDERRDVREVDERDGMRVRGRR